MTHFIYRPKSGDRCFASREHPEIACVEWSNGCRHVAGGCRLNWGTAIPGQYWRSAARQMAERIVARHGGVAWDDQGMVSLIIPCHSAVQAAQLMAACQGEALDDRRNLAPSFAHLAAFVAAGWDLPDEGEVWPRLLVTIPMKFVATDATWQKEKAPRLREGEELLRNRVAVSIPRDATEHPWTVAAPRSWGVPSLWGRPISHKEEPEEQPDPYSPWISFTQADLDACQITKGSIAVFRKEYGESTVVLDGDGGGRVVRALLAKHADGCSKARLLYDRLVNNPVDVTVE